MHIAAVASVVNGFAAATTASTIAASDFVAFLMALGTSALFAIGTSSSVKEFNDQGSWSTVGYVAISAVLDGKSAYVSTKGSSSSSKTVQSTSRGSTGRTQPANLREQLAMEQVKSNPSAGTPLAKITLNDSRWSSSEGWIKMQQIVPTSKGNVNIHYVYNQQLGLFDDFKFKS